MVVVAAGRHAGLASRTRRSLMVKRAHQQRRTITDSRERSSVGRASASQAEGRGFDPRRSLPLKAPLPRGFRVCGYLLRAERATFAGNGRAVPGTCVAAEEPRVAPQESGLDGLLQRSTIRRIRVTPTRSTRLCTLSALRALGPRRAERPSKFFARSEHANRLWFRWTHSAP